MRSEEDIRKWLIAISLTKEILTSTGLVEAVAACETIEELLRWVLEEN